MLILIYKDMYTPKYTKIIKVYTQNKNDSKCILNGRLVYFIVGAY